MDDMLKFLDIVIRKTKAAQVTAKTLKDKMPYSRDLRHLEDARNTLRMMFFAYQDFEKHGDEFDLPVSK